MSPSEESQTRIEQPSSSSRLLMVVYLRSVHDLELRKGNKEKQTDMGNKLQITYTNAKRSRR